MTFSIYKLAECITYTKNVFKNKINKLHRKTNGFIISFSPNICFGVKFTTKLDIIKCKPNFLRKTEFNYR